MEDKQKILTDLYAIRAGMSVISQKKDEIDEAYSHVKEKLLPIVQQTNGNINSVIGNTQSLGYMRYDSKDKYNFDRSDDPEDYKCAVCGTTPIKSGYDFECPVCGSSVMRSALSKTNDVGNQYSIMPENEKFVRTARYSKTTIENLKDAEPLCKNNFSGQKSKRSTFIAFLVIGIILAVVGVVCLIAGFSRSAGLAFGGIAMIVVGGLLAYIFGHLVHDDSTNLRKGIYNLCVQSYNEAIEFNQKADEKLKNIESATHHLVNSCKTLTDEIAQKYNSIDVRDWKYVDTLIFYFETGRADSVKEALQHLDKEIQTKEIISTIKQSAEYICNTIKTCTRQIIERLDRISSQLSSISLAQSVMIQQQTLQTALMAKMARSSESLASDVNYMAERARYNY